MTKTGTSKKIIVAAVAVTCIVIIYAVITAKTSGQGSRGKHSGNNVQTVFSVKTEKAAIRTLHDYIPANGEVEAQSSIEVFPDIGGKVVNVSVSLGSPVKKGQVIAKIDPSEPGSKYALSPVTAPISGSIVSTPLKDGTTVTTSSSITTIGDVHNLQITAEIPEKYVSLLKTGLSAAVTLEAYPGVIFMATVSRVSPVVDASSRTKEIILTFDKDDSRVNAGMFAKITLYTINYSGVVTISGDAIVTKNDKKYAYIVTADNKAEQRELTLGNSVDGIYQVLSGISEGEKVVVEGTSTISDGANIKDITNGTAVSNPAVSVAVPSAEHTGKNNSSQSGEK
jgi:membrane fusion protein, multidrug efflux system